MSLEANQIMQLSLIYNLFVKDVYIIGQYKYSKLHVNMMVVYLEGLMICIHVNMACKMVIQTDY